MSITEKAHGHLTHELFREPLISNFEIIEQNCCFTPFRRMVRLYRESNLRRDEMKDDSPFRHTLAGCDPHTIASGLRFRGQQC